MKLEQKNKKKEGALSSSLIIYTHLVLVFERLCFCLFPFFCFILAYCSLSWIGLFHKLPFQGRFIFLILFAFISILLLAKLYFFRWPSFKDILKRLETENNLPFQALQSQVDHLGENTLYIDPETKLLWEAHKKQLQSFLQNLHRPKLNLNLAHYDPYYLRIFGPLCALLSFFYSYHTHIGKIDDIFSFSAPQKMHLDFNAFVTPPSYSQQESIFLNPEASNNENPYLVPPYSEFHMRIFKKCFPIYKQDKKGHVQKLKPKEVAQEYCVYQSPIENGENFFFYKQKSITGWKFQTPALIKPEIVLNPKDIHTKKDGSLSISYLLKDNFGFTGAHINISPINENFKQRALYQPPYIVLKLPKNSSEKMTTFTNIARHPFAGEKVLLAIIARTKSGKTLKSNAYPITLPRYHFFNKLSSAIAEQRRILAMDPQKKQQVLDVIMALQTHQADLINDYTTALLLQSCWTRLSLAKNDTMLRNCVDYMWAIALEIEKKAMGNAKSRLKRAEQALREALEDNASKEEIQHLMQNLRQAMQDYIKDFLAQHKNQQDLQKSEKNGKTLSQKDTEKLLQKLEDLAQKGQKESAQNLLNQFSSLMENLRYKSQGSASNSTKGEYEQQNPVKMQLDKLSDIMQRQQKLQQDTHHLQNAIENTQKNEEQINKDLNTLAEKQKILEKDLEDLRNQLKEKRLENTDVNSKNDKTKEVIELLENAQKNMKNSEDFLKDQSFYQAKEQQKESLDNLNSAGKKFIKNFGQKTNSANQQERDPLGRILKKNNADGAGNLNDSETKIPSTQSKKRSQKILEEIRKRYQEKDIKEEEKHYLKRLLDLP